MIPLKLEQAPVDIAIRRLLVAVYFVTYSLSGMKQIKDV
jgi:hypothetical protein